MRDFPGVSINQMTLQFVFSSKATIASSGPLCQVWICFSDSLGVMSVAALVGVHATCIQLSSALNFSVSYDSLCWLAFLLEFYFVLFRVLFSSLISVLSLFSHSTWFLSSFHILDWFSYFIQLLFLSSLSYWSYI